MLGSRFQFSLEENNKKAVAQCALYKIDAPNEMQKRANPSSIKRRTKQFCAYGKSMHLN